MNLTIIGASSGIGLNTVNLALTKKHHITTLSRSTQTIPDSPLITKISGDATLTTDISKAIASADAVIITIGKKGKGSNPSTLFSNTAKAFLQAAKEINYTGTVLIVTGFGAGESFKYHTLLIKLIFWLFLKTEYEDKNRMEQLFSASNMNWEIVRPGMLTNKAATRTYKVYTELEKGMKVGSISREDVAIFLLEQAEKPTLLEKYVSLGN